MPSYKLVYFNAMARAEPIRVLFAHAGVDYEDCRIEGKDWPALKPTMPNGTLPVLEVDGKVLSQSKAILRYLAREFNLAGSNNFEMAQCEAVVETIVEMQQAITPLFMEKDETKLAAMRKEALETIKSKLKMLQDNYLAPNGEVFVGNTITVADIDFFAFADVGARKLLEDPVKEFPKLAALQSKVGSEPKIAAWLVNRPATPF